MSTEKILVAVPVRNEVERLPRLIDALAGQHKAPPFILALFFDNCSDDSRALVSSLHGQLPFATMADCCTRGGPPNAGRARRRVMALAASAAPRGVLITTDADGAPARDWVAANLRALDHADVVCGRIVRPSSCGSAVQARLEAYYDRLHAIRRRLDPIPQEAADTHHWTSGASIAARADIYLAAGGFPALPNGEDAAFVDAASRLGFSIRRDAAVRVTTSSRRSGRASNGFAAQLAVWDDAAPPPVVAHPDDEAWRYAMQRHARLGHGTAEFARLALRLNLSIAEVSQVAGECRNGDAFAARIVGAPPRGLRMVSLAHAELRLAALEQGQLEGAA